MGRPAIHPKEERPLRVRYAVLRHRAVARGLPFNLTFERFRELTEQSCHYCGGTAPVMGVDRKDNEAGYDPENVVPCCALCNTWKGTLTVTEFAQHVRRIARHHISGYPDPTAYTPPVLQHQWRELGERRPLPRLARGRRPS